MAICLYSQQLLWLLVECLPNRLTLLYFEIYYKKENYLKVKTVVFKYINSSIVNVKYVSTSVY